MIPPAVAPRSPGRRAIGTLARIGPDKKLEDLVDAFRAASPSLGECELVIGGEAEGGSGSYAADLRARAAGLPVRWLGQVTPEELLSVVDLFALVAEPAGCPNASLEAMAHGRPVLATDVGGMSEQVVSGETGWLVPRGDVDALARGLAAAFADPALLPDVGARGRARAIERFSVERMVDDYARVLGLGLEAGGSSRCVCAV
ncbi:MAG: glycosyltransferase family 4 protein [Myxococcales bacterium]|nr:glycosyltransferase family 4 protein [Myxococcales bacterium]